MSAAAELHQRALHTASEAELLRSAERAALAKDRWCEALDLAEDAVERAGDSPERVGYLLTAAQIALSAREFRRAERLAARGLSDDSVDDRVAAGLRAIVERVRVELVRPSEIPAGQAVLTYSISGPEVCDGRCPPEILIERLAKLQALVMRTAERRLGMPFRTKGAPARVVCDLVAPNMRFEAGGSVMHLDLTPRQLNLLASASEIADDLVRGLEHLAADNRDALAEQIGDDDYRNNFVALSAFLAPDGRRVTTSSVLWSSERNVRRVATFGKALATPSPGGVTPTATSGDAEPTWHVFEGELRGVDETQKHRKIKLIRSDSTTVSIEADEAVLEDIVRPMYGHHVRVRARRELRGTRAVLVMIGVPEEI